jgi:nitroimidazol reductase NimA-like FMN-containing flavoprotein (pyridoxamine 5'-phosphate oxidase superfamily)
MRRKDREILDINEKLDILKRNKVCRLGFVDSDMPYVVPVNYGFTFDDNILTLYFHSANEGRKIDIIRKNNNVCFEIDCDHNLLEGKLACNYGFEFISVIGTGKVTISEKKEEKVFGLSVLLSHQLDKKDNYTFADDMLARTAVFKITIAEFVGKRKMAPKTAL